MLKVRTKTHIWVLSHWSRQVPLVRDTAFGAAAPGATRPLQQGGNCLRKGNQPRHSLFLGAKSFLRGSGGLGRIMLALEADGYLGEQFPGDPNPQEEYPEMTMADQSSGHPVAAALLSSPLSSRLLVGRSRE